MTRTGGVGRIGGDDRGVMSPVAHSLTLGITSLLIIGLLLGTTAMLDNHQKGAAREELRTVGERIAADVTNVDELASQGASASATTEHTDEIAGSTYTVSLHTGTGCDAPRLRPNTESCLRLASHGIDVVEYVPLDNQTEIQLQSSRSGIVSVSAAGGGSDVGPTDVTRLDLNQRLGIGEDVSIDGVPFDETLGNRPPIARFTWSPTTPQAGQTVTFDANESRDPDGDIDTYRWDWDDDGSYDISTGSETSAHTFSTAGKQNVTLQVEDDGGAKHNYTRQVDVSGLVYNDDLDLDGSNNDVTFSVTNHFPESVRITHVYVNPADDSISELNTRGDEISVDASNDGDHSGRIRLARDGRIVELDDPARINSGTDGTIQLQGFSRSVRGVPLELGLQYRIGGDDPNSTRFVDAAGGASISDYEVTASGTNVSLSFESSAPLDDATIEVGGTVSQTLDESDLISTCATTCQYEASISNGTTGVFWANLTQAVANGASSPDTPLNDSAVTASGSLTWSSAADWDAGTTLNGVVHDDFGDHRSDRLELGYPRFDRGGDGLVGYWPLDDPSIAPDVSGTGNDGSVQNSPSKSVGLFGTTSYHLNGFNDHVRVPDSSSLEMADNDTVTVSAWVNKDRAQSDWVAIFQHSDRSYNLQFANGNQPEFTIYDNGTWHSADSTFTSDSGEWNHVVGAFDGDEVRLYVNGSLVSVNDAPDEIEPASSDAGIGRNVDTGGRNLDGQIDEVRVYDRALSPTEVANLYGAHRSGMITTDWKSAGPVFGPDAEVFYNATVDVNEDVRVRVHSRNGTSVEQSDWMSLSDGVGSVDVSGLTQVADEYRLEVELSSGAPDHAPAVQTLGVTDGS